MPFSKSAPHPTSNRTIGAYARLTAINSGVNPEYRCLFGSAPAISSVRVMSVYPRFTARHRGVSPA